MTAGANSRPFRASDGRLIGRLLGDAAPEELGTRAEDLELAAEAALSGGRAALRYYGADDVAVRQKGGEGPVTEADHAANRAILGLLRERRPGERILSEESGNGSPGAGGGEARLWIVDPLDGTREFLARNGEFSIMVGLAEGGASVLGAVYQPEPDLLFLGLAAGGAWVVAGAQHQPDVRPLRPRETGGSPLRFVRSRSHGDPRLDRLEEALGEVAVVRSGSVGIKCALIAWGRADLYVHPVPYLKEWDTCAPEAVLRGAGGRVTDCAGRALSYGKSVPRQTGGIFAAGPGVWDHVWPTVREVASPPYSES